MLRQHYDDYFSACHLTNTKIIIVTSLEYFPLIGKKALSLSIKVIDVHLQVFKAVYDNLKDSSG